MEKVLIIFAKNPVKSKVKTRLAATIGDEQTLLIYRQLLSKTFKVTRDIVYHKFVFYSDFIDENDIWENNLYQKKLQEGNDLGDRMKSAFKTLFTDGYNKIVIIGTDCFELEQEDIEQAFSLLDHSKVVIGPATDGGYYLLGMSEFMRVLFENIEWSTNWVFDQTMAACKAMNVNVSLLRKLNDIDTMEDLKREPALLNMLKK